MTSDADMLSGIVNDKCSHADGSDNIARFRCSNSVNEVLSNGSAQKRVHSGLLNYL